VDVSKQRKNLVIGSVDSEHNWEQDELGDDCEDYTTEHHDEEVLFVI